VIGYKNYRTCHRCSIPIRPSTGHTIKAKLTNTIWVINIICEACQKATSIGERLLIYDAWAKGIAMKPEDWSLLAPEIWAGK